jgi:hypothetical protein
MMETTTSIDMSECGIPFLSPLIAAQLSSVSKNSSRRCSASQACKALSPPLTAAPEPLLFGRLIELSPFHPTPWELACTWASPQPLLNPCVSSMLKRRFAFLTAVFAHRSYWAECIKQPTFLFGRFGRLPKNSGKTPCMLIQNPSSA